MIARFLLSLLLALGVGSALAADTPLWVDAAGQPTAQALEVRRVLSRAAEQGLDPRDYEAATPEQLAAAIERYVSDLNNGRIDPRSIHARFDGARKPRLDAAAWLREAVASGKVAAALREAEPRLPMYAPLKQALAQYRALGEPAAWQMPLPAIPRKKLAEGDAYAGLAVLTQRLQALGDLPAATPVPERYEGALVAGVKAFQERHGLSPDGVLGAATLQALNVTPAARARQIELTMERLRWTPFLQGSRMVAVNVPEFVLRAYEVHDGRVQVRATMKVIVGKAFNTRTPLFDEDMRFIEFSPYWNVPPSIARGEVVPKIRRNPGYFHDQGFEFVTGAGQVVTSLSGEHLDAVLRGAWRIRQRPGPKNALGDIKFVFPNNDNIYLHHTPAVDLFGRDRRDFSHGCIRVEAPVELAKFVLQDEPEWTEERIRQQMEHGSSTTLKLRQPLPVLIAYSTVVVRGGQPHFFQDVYGHDKLLDRALRTRSAGLSPLQLKDTSSK